MSEAKLDQQFVVNIKGKSACLFAGLLDLATRSGLQSQETKIVQVPCADNNNMAVVLATVRFEDGRSFTCVGDACPGNVGGMIAPHVMRMAETRAVGRAFRLALNIQAVMAEELGGDDDHAPQQKQSRQSPPAPERAAPAPAASAPAGAVAAGCCETCSKAMTQGQQTLSQRNFGGRLVCPACAPKR